MFLCATDKCGVFKTLINLRHSKKFITNLFTLNQLLCFLLIIFLVAWIGQIIFLSISYKIVCEVGCNHQEVIQNKMRKTSIYIKRYKEYILLFFIKVISQNKRQCTIFLVLASRALEENIGLSFILISRRSNMLLFLLKKKV